MNIFQLKTQPEGIERVDQFVNEGFVCIGYSRLHDLTNSDKYEIRVELKEKYGYEGSRLGNHLGNVNAFVNTMKIDDVVLIVENEWVHIGKLKEYEYLDEYKLDGMCHRRKVHWLGKVRKDNLNENVRELLRNRSIVTKFKHPSDLAGLDEALVGDGSSNNAVNIDGSLLRRVLSILEAALDSENEQIRVNAAIELLRYYM